MKFNSLLFAFICFSFVFINHDLLAQDSEDAFEWPKELEAKNKTIVTLYQPQLESFSGNILEGRMAITLKPENKDMIFGAVWFKATMSTDKETRIVTLEKMDITRAHFPDIVDEENTRKFSKVLEDEMESWNLDMSMDRLAASLEEVENLKELSDQIKNDPPNIYFRKVPSVLLMIDGEPIMKKDEDSGLEYVVNTSFFIVKDPKKGKYYINGGEFWYSSDAILEGWTSIKKPPSKIEKFAKDNLEEQEKDPNAGTYEEAPSVIIDTKPAELIQVNGEIDYKPIEGTDLLYVANSESDIIMDIPSQMHYVLIGGRWYYSKSLDDGDWKFQEPGELPAGFEKIPEESEMTTVRSSIPGTPEAQTALLEQSIPQTATIDRKTATVEVSYDGEPEFEAIEGTSMSYAKNTDKSVLLIEGKYYCVDNAVWFVSDKAKGPWAVSDSRPDDIDSIPPECPVYNVKYTYVYDSTPEVVYVGYLPGYTYSYVYSGVVVYGTGYYYYPWYRYYYYPRPVTFGFGVHWNPYSGWGFSFGFSFGWMSWRFHPYRYGYWGARGFRHGYRHGYRRGYAAGRAAGYRRGYASTTRNNANRNVYNNRQNGVARTNDRSTRNVNSKARPSNKANNMYSDRNGNVYQRNNSGGFDNKSNANRASSGQAQQRPSTTQSQQRPSTTQTQPKSSTQQQNRSSTQPSTSQNLNRSYQSRSQGSSNYSRSRSSGAARGGGGRRR